MIYTNRPSCIVFAAEKKTKEPKDYRNRYGLPGIRADYSLHIRKYFGLCYTQSDS